MRTERRATNRNKVHPDEIHAFIYPIQKTYPIKDINRGGLAIDYSPTAEPFIVEKIDITAKDYDQFCLSKLPCKTVYDISTLIERRSFTGGKLRTCGLRFVELTNEQEEKLDILLKRLFDRSA